MFSDAKTKQSGIGSIQRIQLLKKEGNLGEEKIDSETNKSNSDQRRQRTKTVNKSFKGNKQTYFLFE